MFDLVDLLKNSQPENDPKEKITSVLFYQTEKCRELVLEAYRFEGITDPEVLTNDDLSISDHVRQQSIEVVIVELNKSQNVTRDAERISHLLPSHASVIVIGCEDAISTIRNLKEMGFYYLFWPISKQELIDFVKSVNVNRASNRGPGQKRRAKKISIIGAKGGVGTTLLVSEVAHQLVSDKKSNCVVIDHNYHSGDIDIMMGIPKFDKRMVQRGALLTSLDLTTINSLIAKQSDMLSVLSLTSDDLTVNELNEYTDSIVDLLSPEVNFFVEDLSASAISPLADNRNWMESDCVILVVTPTISAVRDAARIKKALDTKTDDTKPRLIVVVNHVVPEKSSTVKLTEIEKFLNYKPQVVLPYVPNAAKDLVEGKRLAKSSSGMKSPLKRLVSLILGESLAYKSKSGIASLFSRNDS
ncbi:AAA family ATPase [Vibrio sp. RC27]